MPLQDTDNLIVGRGSESYKITYEDLKDKLEEDGLAPTPPDPVEIKKPVVLSPANGAGIGGDVSYFPETSAIDVNGVSGTDPVTLTLTNDKAFDSETGDEKSTIDQVFKAGNKVEADTDSSITGVLTEDADAAAKTMTLSDVTGVWADGMKAVNQTEATSSAPGADDIVFTSDKPIATSGTVNSWGMAKWELTNTDTSDVQTKEVPLTETDVVDGPTDFTLEANTTYSVRVGYSSADPEATVQPVYSDVSNFKTAGASGGAYGNFSTTVYPGKNFNQTIDTGVDNTGKALVWIKAIDNSRSHILTDTERGTDSFLNSDSSNAAGTNTNRVTAFNNNGFDLGVNASTSQDGENYVAWNFAAAAGFFDVVKYNPTSASGNYTIPHSLGTKPGMIIKKRTNSDSAWRVYHQELGADYNINLNSNAAATTHGTWGNTEPTATEWTDGPNQTTDEWVAYLFADNPNGGIKCGSYTGTAASNQIDCGFDVGWVLIKNTTTASSDWLIRDKSREPNQLVPNSSGAEGGAASAFSFSTNGFTLGNNNTSYNSSGDTFIFVAIADTTVTFYDENTASTVTNHTLTKRYGVDPLETDLRKFGIFPLTEQPDYSVDTYVKVGESYKPIRNYSSEMRQLSEARSRLASIESDEVNDDATDTALLTLLANLTQRVTDLEQSN